MLGSQNEQEGHLRCIRTIHSYTQEVKDGQANKAVADRSSESSQSDDGRGIERIRRRDSERDGQLEDDDFNPLEDEFTLTVHTANGRSLGLKPGEFVTKKHQQHDQSLRTVVGQVLVAIAVSLLVMEQKNIAEQNNIEQDTSIHLQRCCSE
jgi:hypothetical protein